MTDDLLRAVRAKTATFADVLAHIQTHYDYSPTAFRNGNAANSAGQNEGACRVFAYAQLVGLSENDTLLCFAEHYASVLASPSGSDHANIRAFMDSGWAGIAFDTPALRART